ncbi:MAG: hypothetical protein JWR62_3145, partial [Modestobacter sp.]|nr:hypothetical protein [Modestobacter sp.]
AGAGVTGYGAQASTRWTGVAP